MKQYEKTIDGKTVRKNRNQIVVRKDGKQTINPSDELLKDDGWTEYVAPTQSEEDEEVKARRSLQESDDKVIRCMEAYLCGEELPYDIKKLHKERNEHRNRIGI